MDHHSIEGIRHKMGSAAHTAMNTEGEFRRQKERLELLLNLTTKITSSLDLREVLRAIAANIREVIHADAVTVVLPDAASEKFRVFAMDFPHGKGVIKEELLVTPSAAVKKAIDTLKPLVFDTRGRNELAPEPYDVVAAEGAGTHWCARRPYGCNNSR
jgi:formate hydrogenlyase transcriptional activator